MNKALPLDLLRNWIESLIKSLDESLDERKKREIMERCGKACALYHGSLEQVEAIKRKSKGLKEILEGMNQEELWCGGWETKGKNISSVCQSCGCPLFRAGVVRPSKVFCYCSLGWVKSVFEVIVGKPVRVELKRAIGRGDDVCEFVVHGDQK